MTTKDAIASTAQLFYIQTRRKIGARDLLDTTYPIVGSIEEQCLKKAIQTKTKIYDIARVIYYGQKAFLCFFFYFLYDT
jgi:hypothetical protein